MILQTYAVAVCASASVLICTFLILCGDYDDGILGKLALIALVIASLAYLDPIVEYGFRSCPPFSGREVLGWIGFCLFMMRHAYRFERYRSGGRFNWSHGRASL